MKQERQGRGRANEAHWQDYTTDPRYYRTDDSPPHIPTRGMVTGTAVGLAMWLIVTLAAFIVYAVY